MQASPVWCSQALRSPAGSLLPPGAWPRDPGGGRRLSVTLEVEVSHPSHPSGQKASHIQWEGLKAGEARRLCSSEARPSGSLAIAALVPRG